MTTPTPRVIYRDADFLVLDKPAFLSTTSPNEGDCLVVRARALDPEAERLHPTSRLDSEVTGIVTFARTRVATELALEARRRGVYRRRYVAISAVTPDSSRGVWTWPIQMHPRDRRLRTTGEGSRSQTAETRFEVLAVCGDACLLNLFPATGRTHQLRVHAARAGAPLLGDTSYGGLRRVVLHDGRVRTAPRVMLHCAEVELPVPRRAAGKVLRFLSEIPADFASVWVGLGGDAAAL